MDFIETGTGLDGVIDSVLNNDDLHLFMTDKEINRALKAATKLNDIIVEAIRETGVIEEFPIPVPNSMARELLFPQGDWDAVVDYIQDNYAKKVEKLFAKVDPLFEESVWNVDTGYEFVYRAVAGEPLGGLWSATVPYSTISWYLKDDLQSGILYQSYVDPNDDDDHFEFKKGRKR